MSPAPPAKQRVLIVGSGIFGVSTAISFLEKGGYDVRIIDKAKELPAVDAASTDLNKIIRAGDYASPVLAKMSVDAVHEWRKPKWQGTYHETGCVVIAEEPKTIGGEHGMGGLDFIQEAQANLAPLGVKAVPLLTAEAIRNHFPEDLRSDLASFEGKKGYYNPMGGWAEAERAVSVGMQMVLELGGQIGAGMEVDGLVLSKEASRETGKRVAKGVKLKDGTVLEADLVIICTGAWTPSLFPSPSLGIASLLQASGQSVAKIQLTKEEAERQARFPVIFNLSSGYYTFPPNPEGIVKVAIHGLGYICPDANGISKPRTVLTPGAEKGYIPKEMVDDLRTGTKEFFPKLGEKDFFGTRLCWYTDSPSGEWLIDYQPDIEGLLFATGGCGHAFKFLPTIGNFVLARHLGTLPPDLASMWAFGQGRAVATGADHRREGDVTRKVLVEGELATAIDLKA